MKVVHVVARMITGSSGPSYSVPSLCKALGDQGADVELHMVGEHRDFDASIKILTYPGVPYLDRLGVSPAMKRGLIKAAKSADIMHTHSLWMMPNIYPLTAVNKSDKCKLLVSPRGTLSNWAMSQSKFRKRLMWQVGQKGVLHQADCIHATAMEELEDVRRLQIATDVAVIPNGIDLPVASSASQELSSDRRQLLFLSRIHPKKGIDGLLNVWARLEKSFPEWELIIAGPIDGDYPRQMQQKVIDMGLARVSFPGELTGKVKSNVFMQADCFALPTHSENFGMVVAEALAHETPVVVTKGAPWRGVEENDCGWWIDIGEPALEDALTHMMALPKDKLKRMGANGRAWMRKDYSWSKIAENMMDTYRWLKGEGECPQVVHKVTSE